MLHFLSELIAFGWHFKSHFKNNFYNFFSYYSFPKHRNVGMTINLNYGSTPIPIPMDYSAPLSIAPKPKRKVAAISIASIKNRSLSTSSPLSIQRLSQYKQCHPLSDEYVPFEDVYMDGYYDDDDYESDGSEGDYSINGSGASFVSASFTASGMNRSESNLPSPLQFSRHYSSYKYQNSPRSISIPKYYKPNSNNTSTSPTPSPTTSPSPSYFSTAYFSPPLIIASSSPTPPIPRATSVSATFKSGSKLSHSSSTESLISILNSEPKPKPKPSPRKASFLVSNLSSSFKSWKHNLLTYSVLALTPRMTDDKLPSTSVNVQTPLNGPQELTTFTEPQAQDLALPPNYIPNKKSFKNRDQRVNSFFLRLYAIDYNARIHSHTLPNSYSSSTTGRFLEDAELSRLIAAKPHLKAFHYNYSLFQVSNTSRDKLWNNVILPPRSDESPSVSIDPTHYIFIGEESDFPSSMERKLSYSLIRKSGNYLPWDNNHNPITSLKPAGVLHNSVSKANGLAPSSGVTKTQFTVRGWCNPRWLALSD